MKHIKNFIFEKQRLGKKTYNNTPDFVTHNKRSLSWSNRYARAFIYNKELDDFLFSDKGNSHISILDDEPSYILKRFGLLDKELRELRFYSDNEDDLYDVEEWKEYYKENNSKFKLGRIWIIPKDEWDNDEDLVYVAWWNELSSREFNKYNKRLLDYINKLLDKNYTCCVFIDNNGVTKLFDEDKKVRVKKASEQRKEELNFVRNIHLATQKEKKEFFKEFIKKRDEYNQQKYYNHTKSKTEAEWRSIKYQESLEE